MLRKKEKLGFTLIELLVVIAILGTLASIILVSTKNVRKNSRDAKRIVEFNQITTVLEVYYSDNGEYPSPNDRVSLDSNWFDMLSMLEDGGYFSQIDLIEEKDSIWSKLILEVKAMVGPPSYSRTTPQDPLYPSDGSKTYAYVPSINQSKYRIRCQFDNLDNPALNTSIEGNFLYDGVPTGDNACDTSLGYYCAGSRGDFDPGS